MAKKDNKPSYDLTKRFSFDTIENFDNHISTHIKDYDRLRATILYLADSFIIRGKRVYDIGCSTGSLIRSLDKQYADRKVEYVGIDVNYNFAKDFEDSDTVKFNKADVTRGYNYTDASLIISLFTLQFIDPKDRFKVLDSIAESLDIGYGFIISEKTYPDSAFAYKVLEDGSNDYKEEVGIAETEVAKKPKTLRDIMRPFEADLLESELKKRFRSVTVIWASFNFKAYLCVK